VVVGACARAEVKGSAGEDAIVEVAFETWIFCVEWAKVIDVVVEEIWCPSRKAGYA
jgi:hypothetical protein